MRYCSGLIQVAASAASQLQHTHPCRGMMPHCLACTKRSVAAWLACATLKLRRTGVMHRYALATELSGDVKSTTGCLPAATCASQALQHAQGPAGARIQPQCARCPGVHRPMALHITAGKVLA